ncbi:6-bladed beta-propeller [Parabacteroides sp. AM08-6]|uniref:6-bladed beta-propeller n=1 Tax=Parabacteroides sp. AM08-6 TaxID=2292053 RepID=UPI000F001AA9|nr:6-bladed beta-propeller [Parabacteroides sp. AM08-6]RHJ79320.1 6-bladed beta-propeller [Parabacteroides sp. AM08-6]
MRKQYLIKTIIPFWFILVCCSCQELIMKNKPFPSVNLDSVTVVPTKDEKFETIKVSNEIKEPMPSSELIEDFYYTPLETTDKSLFAYCNHIEFYDNKIYAFDRLGTEKLYLFDNKGKFLKSLGEKGGAPFEFYLPKSFAIDTKQEQLVIYDNQKRKWMQFSLNGDYITSHDVPFRIGCNFKILSNGEYVTATDKGARNNHLGQYDDYKILYTDSLGHLQKAACFYQETVHSSLAYDPLSRRKNEIIYAPMYLNEVYTVTDTALCLRYKFDYSDFIPFEKDKMGTFENYEDFHDYELAHTYLYSYVENDTHIMFVTSDKDDRRFISFYDKRSKKLVNTAGMLNDMDFVMDFASGLYSYNDYFVALVPPATLKSLKQVIDETTHYPAKEENMRLFETIKEDDNLVVVFFKIKDL